MTIVVDPDDIIRALEHNHLKETAEKRSVLVSLEEPRTDASYVDLAPWDPLPGEAQTLLKPSAFVRDSLRWAKPPTRAELKRELGGSYSSEYEVDELHAFCVSGWRDQIRTRIEDSVLLDQYSGEIARIEVASEGE
jgi:hypothetical protein